MTARKAMMTLAMLFVAMVAGAQKFALVDME